jgi:hypothetical protein
LLLTATTLARALSRLEQALAWQDHLSKAARSLKARTNG